MTGILIGTGVLAAVALVFSLLLTLANKVFEVPNDPRRDEVRAALPGANCGACGFAGCDALADAIAAGTAPVNACPVGGSRVANQVATILGAGAVADAVKGLPRKEAAVRGHPVGSVMIAGPQCLITTLPMPTGWWVIGRTPLLVLDATADKPFRFEPGDRVRFTRSAAT